MTLTGTLLEDLWVFMVASSLNFS